MDGSMSAEGEHVLMQPKFVDGKSVGAVSC
jgi:hypothetical protein